MMNPRTMLSLASFAANGADMHARGLGYLNGLSDYVQAGTVIQWVGRFYLADGSDATEVNYSTASTVANDLNAMLYTGGWFSDVRVTWNGVLNIDFIVEVTAGTDFARLSDIASIIEGVAWNLGGYSGWPHLAAQRFELNVLSVPKGNKPTSAQPTPSPTGGGGNTQGGGQSNQNNQQAPAQCVGQYNSNFCGCGKAWGWFPPGCYAVDASGKFLNDEDSGVDKFAKWLGVKPSQAVIIGALGAVLAVVAVKRVL